MALDFLDSAWSYRKRSLHVIACTWLTQTDSALHSHWQILWTTVVGLWQHTKLLLLPVYNLNAAYLLYLHSSCGFYFAADPNECSDWKAWQRNTGLAFWVSNC